MGSINIWSLLKKGSNSLAKTTKYVHLATFFALSLAWGLTMSLIIPAEEGPFWLRFSNGVITAFGISILLGIVFWLIPYLVMRAKKRKGKNWSGVLAAANLWMIRYVFLPCLGVACVISVISFFSGDTANDSFASTTLQDASSKEKMPLTQRDLEEQQVLFTRCRSKAAEGNAEAQFELAKMYDYGKGVSTNKKEACIWYALAADQGYVKAQYNLGWMYDHGEGVSKNYKEARKWYMLAAEQSHAKAQYSIGRMYYEGEGVAKDFREARKWYMLAAEQGNANAQYQLCLMDWDGEGGPRDKDKSLEWCVLAAENGHALAKRSLRRIGWKID